MYTLIIAGIVFMIFLIILLLDWKYENKKRKEWVKKHYGQVPVKTGDTYELISMFWEEFNREIPGEKMIDEVTWSDLEMNLVFDRINNCTSFAGEQMLYSELHRLSEDKEYLNNLEKQITYYDENTDKREHMQWLLCRLGKEESSYYLPLFISNLEMLGMSHIWFYRSLQILLGISVIIALINGESIALLAALVIFLFNAVVYGVKKTEHEVYMDTLGGIIRLVKVANLVLRDKRQSAIEIPENILDDLKLFKRITRMIGVLQKKKQAALSGDIIGILRDYFIGATLWDFSSYHKIILFLRGKEEKFMEIYKFIGKIDMSISIASFRKSLHFYCTPEFTEEKVLEMEEVYHLLIRKPVCNTVTISKHCMITGSNASGKSTFIKAAMVNAVLAQNIHTCMAKYFKLPSARIITSMAIRDDIVAGESYYMKEIKYLKRIIESLQNERMVICAVDEILRGTNTKERIAASSAVLNHLSQSNCLALVATHDLELTNFLGEKFYYYYFCDQMTEKDVAFDYKIQKGVCNSSNAIKLLDYVGFPEEIIEEARYNYSH